MLNPDLITSKTEALIFLAQCIQQAGWDISQAITTGPKDPVHGISGGDVEGIGLLIGSGLSGVSDGLEAVAEAINHTND